MKFCNECQRVYYDSFGFWIKVSDEAYQVALANETDKEFVLCPLCRKKKEQKNPLYFETIDPDRYWSEND